MNAQTKQSRSRSAAKYLAAAAIGAAGLQALKSGIPRELVIRAMERRQMREENAEKNPINWSGVSMKKFQTFLDSCGQNLYLTMEQKNELHAKFNHSPVFRKLIRILDKASRLDKTRIDGLATDLTSAVYRMADPDELYNFTFREEGVPNVFYRQVIKIRRSFSGLHNYNCTLIVDHLVCTDVPIPVKFPGSQFFNFNPGGRKQCKGNNKVMPPLVSSID